MKKGEITLAGLRPLPLNINFPDVIYKFFEITYLPSLSLANSYTFTSLWGMSPRKFVKNVTY